MNWTRGFLRLWAALAVCWVTGASINIGHDLVGMRFVGEVSRDPVLGLKRCWETHPTLEKKITPLNPKDCNDSRNYEPDWPFRIETAAQIVGPPALLLLIGFVVAWIARGFRSSAPPEG